MGDTPPRRSRPKPASGNSTLPFVPVLVAIVIFGFVIGAAFSVIGKRGSTSQTLALATSSPTPLTLPLVPTPIPGSPEPLASPVASATPSLLPSPHATPHATPRPSPRPTPTLAPATSAPAPSATPTHRALVVATHAPVVAATSAPTAAPAPRPSALAAVITPVPPTSAPTTIFDADTEFSRLAGNVVRQYLLSISRGDLDSAYAALGQGPGTRSVTLPESGVLDAAMRIEKIQARGTDSAATVNVDLMSASGPYTGQYTLHKSPTGAAIIVSHTFGKP